MFFSITKRILPLALFVSFTSFWGCSSLLYYPSQKVFVKPENIVGRAPESVTFFSDNGKSLHGWYFRNKRSPTPKGLLVFFHGNAQNITTHFAALHWILDEGYDYFIFDYQGYGDSQGRPSPRKMVQDGRQALFYAARRRPGVPLIVLGQSLGGAVALSSVLEVKDSIPIAALIIDSSFLSYKKVAQKTLARHWLTWPAQPLAFVLLSDHYAPRDQVSQLSPIPLLIFHGDKDTTVPFELGEDLYQKAKEPKKFIPVPGGRHGDLFWREQGRYRRILMQELDKIVSSL